MDRNLFLTTPLAQTLYQSAAALPLVDYHNHLSVSDIARNRVFDNITQMWLAGDPYKHRLMRICGVDEHFITGAASDAEKFAAWCRVFPDLVGNPLYDWCRMEMEWVFGIDLTICGKNADALWQETNARLREPAFSAQGLLDRFDCRYAAPCTKLLDDLSPFSGLSRLAPSLRGDDLLFPTAELIRGLSAVAGVRIGSREGLREALRVRLEAFCAVGCRFADHALDSGFRYVPDDGQAEARFAACLECAPADRDAVACDMLRLLAPLYAEHGWVMQLHIGAQRYTSSRLRRLAGATGGFAAIGNSADAASLAALLDDLEAAGGLPRTLLFPMNPTDNAVISVLTGSFSETGAAPKVGQGPAWWWNDHAYGMRRALEAMRNYSVLSVFIGMTTDSRSLLSMLRHDYFRRVLCGWLGELAARGEMPEDPNLLTALVRRLCYENAAACLKGVSL